MWVGEGRCQPTFASAPHGQRCRRRGQRHGRRVVLRPCGWTHAVRLAEATDGQCQARSPQERTNLVTRTDPATHSSAATQFHHLTEFFIFDLKKHVAENSPISNSRRVQRARTAHERLMRCEVTARGILFLLVKRSVRGSPWWPRARTSAQQRSSTDQSVQRPTTDQSNCTAIQPPVPGAVCLCMLVRCVCLQVLSPRKHSHTQTRARTHTLRKQHLG